MEDGFRSDIEVIFKERIAIIGLGLIGGSLALALRDRCRMLMAVDPDPATRDRAVQDQIIDQISNDPAEIIPKADVVILAAPVDAILDLIPQLPILHPGGPIVIDLGSTKTQINRGLENLPARFETIGGHPMCGKAVSGLEYAESNLFQDMPFAFTPLPRTTERAYEFAGRLAGAVGAKPVWIGPKTHDSWVAATSHLPYLLASALALATPAEAAQLVGPGFRSTSRLAGSPSSVMLPILETNREPVLEALARFRSQLDRIEELLSQGDFSTLETNLDLSADHQSTLTGI